MTTFICYYKYVHQYRWLLLHLISPGNLSKKYSDSEDYPFQPLILGGTSKQGKCSGMQE